MITKKRIASIGTAALLFAVMSLTACFSDDEGTMDFTQQTVEENNYVAQSSDTVVSGEVTAIVGNSVTLALGEVSESENTGAADAGEEEADFSGEMPSGGDMPDMSGGEMPDMGDMDMSDFGGGGNGGGGNGGGGRGKSSSATIEKSGEEATYILPVGMPIGSGDYSNISEGDILTLTINSEGIVCAAEVD